MATACVEATAGRSELTNGSARRGSASSEDGNDAESIDFHSEAGDEPPRRPLLSRDGAADFVGLALTYLPSKELVLSVRLVCKGFALLVDQDYLWLSRWSAMQRTVCGSFLGNRSSGQLFGNPTRFVESESDFSERQHFLKLRQFGCVEGLPDTIDASEERPPTEESAEEATRPRFPQSFANELLDAVVSPASRVVTKDQACRALVYFEDEQLSRPWLDIDRRTKFRATAFDGSGNRDSSHDVLAASHRRLTHEMELALRLAFLPAPSETFSVTWNSQPPLGSPRTPFGHGLLFPVFVSTGSAAAADSSEHRILAGVVVPTGRRAPTPVPPRPTYGGSSFVNRRITPSSSDSDCSTSDDEDDQDGQSPTHHDPAEGCSAKSPEKEAEDGPSFVSSADLTERIIPEGHSLVAPSGAPIRFLFPLRHIALYQYLVHTSLLTDVNSHQFRDGSEEKFAVVSRMVSPAAKSVEFRFFYSSLGGSFPRVFIKCIWCPSSFPAEQMEEFFSSAEGQSRGCELFQGGFGRVEVDVRPIVYRGALVSIAEHLGLPEDFPLRLLWNAVLCCCGGMMRMACHTTGMAFNYDGKTFAQAFEDAVPEEGRIYPQPGNGSIPIV